MPSADFRGIHPWGSKDNVGFAAEGKTLLYHKKFDCSGGLGFEKHFRMKGVIEVSNIMLNSPARTPGCFRSAARWRAE